MQLQGLSFNEQNYCNPTQEWKSETRRRVLLLLTNYDVSTNLTRYISIYEETKVTVQVAT